MQGGLDDAGSESGSAVGVAGSSWGGSNSTRALRRRGSSGSSEFYFVDQPQQQGGAAGSEFIQVLLMPPLFLAVYPDNQPPAAPRVGVDRIIRRKACGDVYSSQTVPLRMYVIWLSFIVSVLVLFSILSEPRPCSFVVHLLSSLCSKGCIEL